MRRDLEDWLRGKTNLPPVAEPPVNVFKLNLPVVFPAPSLEPSSAASMPSPFLVAGSRSLASAPIARDRVKASPPEESPLSEESLLPEESRSSESRPSDERSRPSNPEGSSLPEFEEPVEPEAIQIQEAIQQEAIQMEKNLSDLQPDLFLRDAVEAHDVGGQETSETIAPEGDVFGASMEAAMGTSTGALMGASAETSAGAFMGNSEETDFGLNAGTEEMFRTRYAAQEELEKNETSARKRLPLQESEASRLTEQLRHIAQMRQLASDSSRRFSSSVRRRRFFTVFVLFVLVVGTIFAAYRSMARNTYDSLMKEADTFYEQERYEESLELYRQTASRYPDRPDPFLGMARASERVGRIEEAAVAYRSASAHFSAEDTASLSRISYETGRLYTMLKMWDKARKNFEDAIVADATNYSAHFSLGNVFEEQKMPKEAAKAYKHALDLSPSSDAAQEAIKRVSLLLPSKEADFAAFEAEKIEKARSVAKVALDLKRYDKASQYFAEILALNSADVDAWIGFAEARNGLGDTAGAISSLRRALVKEPKHEKAKALLKALEESRSRNVPQRAPARRRRTSFVPSGPFDLSLFKTPDDDQQTLAVPVGGVGGYTTFAEVSTVF